MRLQAESTQAYRGDVLVQTPARARRPRASASLRHEARLAYTILAPSLLVMLFLVVYPFFSAMYLSVQDKMVGAPGRFVGLANYVELFRDDVFLRTAWNSVRLHRGGRRASSSSSASRWRWSWTRSGG